MNLFGESALFVALAVVVFLCASVVEILFVIYQLRECKVIETAIKDLKPKNGEIKAGFSFKEGETKLDKTRWIWIKEHLAGTIEGNGKEYKPEVQDNRFILAEYPIVLARSISRSPLSFIPTLLTAIGLLGTFWGISTGLSKFDLSAINESNKLLAASIGVLAGMKTAFFSSLVGLGCASAFMVVLFACSLVRKTHRDRLRRKLDKIAVLSTTEAADQRAAQALIYAAKTMKGLTPQAIGQEVGAALTPVFEEIRRELKTLREIKEDQGQEVLKNLIQELRADVLLPIAERLDQSAELTQSASQAVMNLQTELGGISKSLADSILTIQHFQKETLGRLEEFAGGLRETLGQFQNETRTVLQEVAQEIKQGVDQSIVGMEAQRTAFAESATNAADTFRGIREDLQAALHTQAEVEKQMLQQVQHRTVEILDAANTTFQQQAHTLEAVGTEASSLMRGAKAELMMGLQEINGMLHQTHQTTQQELGHFRQNYQASLQEFFAQSATGMEAQRTAFAESATNAADTFRGIREDLQAALHTQAKVEKQMLQDVEARMTSILKDTHTAFQTQSATLETVGNEASGLMNNAKENLVGSLQNIDGMLQNTRQTVQEELEHFRQGYQASLQDFFTRQNNLLESTLGEQRQGLAQVVEDLQTAFQKEAIKRQALAQEVDQSMANIQHTVEVVNNLANAVGLNSGARLAQIQELSHGMGKQVLKLESAYNNLANQFSESLHKGNEQVTKYLQGVAESETRFFKDADQATAKLCNNLLQAANYLVAAEDNNRRERGDSQS